MCASGARDVPRGCIAVLSEHGSMGHPWLKHRCAMEKPYWCRSKGFCASRLIEWRTGEPKIRPVHGGKGQAGDVGLRLERGHRMKQTTGPVAGACRRVAGPAKRLGKPGSREGDAYCVGERQQGLSLAFRACQACVDGCMSAGVSWVLADLREGEGRPLCLGHAWPVLLGRSGGLAGQIWALAVLKNEKAQKALSLGLKPNKKQKQ